MTYKYFNRVSLIQANLLADGVGKMETQTQTRESRKRVSALSSSCIARRTSNQLLLQDPHRGHS